jgi:PAS domain-containing protein
MRTYPVEKVQLDELFELSPDAVILTGEDFHVLRVNKEFTRIFGQSRRGCGTWQSAFCSASIRLE